MKDEEIINLIIRHLCRLPFNKNSVRWNILKKDIGISIDNETTKRIFNTLENENICKVDSESNNSFGKYDHPISLINSDNTMIDLFISEYKNSNFFPINKDLPTEILNGFNKCKAAGLIQKRNKFDFEWTEKGLEAKKFNSYQEYLDKQDIPKTSITYNETIIGDKIQDSSFGDFKPINNPSKADTIIPKSHIREFFSTTISKIIGTVIGGALLWLLVQQVLIPYFNNI